MEFYRLQLSIFGLLCEINKKGVKPYLQVMTWYVQGERTESEVPVRLRTVLAEVPLRFLGGTRKEVGNLRHTNNATLLTEDQAYLTLLLQKNPPHFCDFVPSD